MNYEEQIKTILPNLGQVEITYYTDPLCCWSWAFQPQWERFVKEYGHLIKVKYRMGGLLKDWNTFKDPMNSISRPAQMGPLWMEAKNISGQPINDFIWINDPPGSSYPACIAVKTAALQSVQAEEAYLLAVREAVMVGAKNISKPEILLEIADALDNLPFFDPQRFRMEFNNEASRQAFREDLEKVRLHQITRFPTITMQPPKGKGIILVGYRPYDVLLDAFKAVEAALE